MGVDQFFGKPHPPGPLHLGTMPYTPGFPGYTLRGTRVAQAQREGGENKRFGDKWERNRCHLSPFSLTPLHLGLHWVLVQVEEPGVGKFHRKIEPHPLIRVS